MRSRLLIALTTTCAVALPTAAYAANRSPGHLYVGEAVASIREHNRQVGDLTDYAYERTRVGRCRRITYMRVKCTGEAEYTSYDDGSTAFCRGIYQVTESATTGRHEVLLRGRISCAENSIFD